MRTRRSDPGCALRIHVCFLYGLGPLCRAWSYAEALRSARTVRLDGFRCMQSGIYRGLSGHVPSDSQEVFRKHQTCAQHQVFIYELSAETSRPGTLKFPTIEPFLLLSPFSPRRPIPPGSSFFRRLLRLPFPACFTACFTSLFTDLFALRAHATIARYIGNHERRNRKHNRQRRQQ